MDSWSIEPLGPDHDRSQFSCGQPSLDRFLKEFAGQNQAKDFSRTYVLVRDDDPCVCGYYTLSAGQIERERLPPKHAKKLPKYPVPVVVLGRLAVDESVKGAKHGRRLLWDALQRSLSAAELIGIYAVFVDAIDEPAAKFYERFGFIPLTDSPLRLFLPFSTIRKVGGGSQA